MIRRDRKTIASAQWRGTSLPLALFFLLATACGSDSAEPTRQNDDPAEADEGEDEDEPSSTKRDAGSQDAGRKDAGRDAGEPSKPASRPDAGSPSSDGGKSPSGSGRDAGSTPTPTADAGGGTTTNPTPGDGSICARWKSDRANISEGTWNGSVDSCTPGEMTPEAIANALRLFNMYRFMVGLPPVTNSIEGNRLAQACALMMKANGTITHTPPTTWKCYTEEGAKTAGSSSVSSGPAVGSVEGYMIDPGNPTTIGHRRWIISNMLTEVGFGSADRFSCQYQPAKFRAPGGKPWVAWPPAGQVPIQALGGKWVGTVDMTGWTVQSDSINLANATVTVTSGGMDRPVTVTQLLPGYGSMYAIRFNPMGWTAAAGQTYSVKVGGIAMPIEYEVQVVDCP